LIIIIISEKVEHAKCSRTLPFFYKSQICEESESVYYRGYYNFLHIQYIVKKEETLKYSNIGNLYEN